MQVTNVEIKHAKVDVVPELALGESELLAAIVPQLTTNQFEIHLQTQGLVCPYLPLDSVGTSVNLGGDAGERPFSIEIEIGSYGAEQVGQFANSLLAVYDEVLEKAGKVSIAAVITGVISFSSIEFPSVLRQGKLRIGSSEIARSRALEFEWHEDDKHCTVRLRGSLPEAAGIIDILDGLLAFRESLKEQVVSAFVHWFPALHELEWYEPSKGDG